MKKTSKRHVTCNCNLLQSDPNQNCPFIRTVSLKLSTSDPVLVKPNCVSDAVVFWKNCKQAAEKCRQTFQNEHNYLLPLKRI